MTQEQIHYAYLQQLRRRSLYRLRYLQAIKLQKIQSIRQFIISGGDPTADPDIREDYFALCNEFGKRIFEFDDNIDSEAILTTEQDSDVKNG